MLLSVEPAKPRVGLLNRSYLFGTALLSVSFDGGNGIGFFEPQDVARVQGSIRRAHYHTEAAMRLWTMIVTEIWAEIYLDHRGRCPDSSLQRAA